ncbi:hypothetical protein [Leekyejoonella antrihumi]|uniref:Class I SAM-dependent methyltransferase n=1 Tax=Leekyejoonella antrihumi TaxID=1660198 RepID=A0A563DYK7_9MICO|nr:hypothetical protein [Leekyejoonella antrihumi]TWP35081.1 hypothetical protein FGL98_15100 [Leekyejoonella antrihumi]
MQSYQVDASSGSRLIGGDMLEWSDLDHTPGLSSAGYLVARLVHQTHATRVLLAGPRAAALVDSVPASVETDLLVRGLPDARRLATMGGSLGHLQIYCGGLDRYHPEVPYDLIIALDGPETLLTPDSVGLSHAEVAARIGGWVAPKGTVAMLFNNELGLDSMLRLELRSMYDADDQWHHGAPGFDARRPYVRELPEALAGAGLSIDVKYSVFPSRENLSLLISDAAAQDEHVAAGLHAAVARTEGSHFATNPALIDPYTLTRQVMDAGLTADLAPVWLLIAHPSAGSSSLETSLPAVISADHDALPEWTAVMTFDQADEKNPWTCSVHTPRGATTMSERRVTRDTSVLAMELSPGRLLEADLREACAGGNLAHVRVLVQRYAAWIRDDAAWKGHADQRFFAVPSNVIVRSDGSFTLFDASWSWSETLSADVAVLRGIRDFCRRMLQSGAEHPWKPDISPDDLAHTMSTMIDLSWSAQAIEAVGSREAELEVVVHGGNAMAESNALAANLESGASQLTATPGPSRGYRESLATSGRMSHELYQRGGQVQWLEATLRARDARVGELEHTLGQVRDSTSFKIGRGVTYPGRAAMGSARHAAISMLPPGFVPRARLAVRRLLNAQARR